MEFTLHPIVGMEVKSESVYYFSLGDVEADLDKWRKVGTGWRMRHPRRIDGQQIFQSIKFFLPLINLTTLSVLMKTWPNCEGKNRFFPIYYICTRHENLPAGKNTSEMFN